MLIHPLPLGVIPELSLSNLFVKPYPALKGTAGPSPAVCVMLSWLHHQKAAPNVSSVPPSHAAYPVPQQGWGMAFPSLKPSPRCWACSRILSGPCTVLITTSSGSNLATGFPENQLQVFRELNISGGKKKKKKQLTVEPICPFSFGSWLQVEQLEALGLFESKEYLPQHHSWDSFLYSRQQQLTLTCIAMSLMPSLLSAQAGVQNQRSLPAKSSKSRGMTPAQAPRAVTSPTTAACPVRPCLGWVGTEGGRGEPGWCWG